jgi:hypothetical protein
LRGKANFFSCARVTKSELFGVKKLPAKSRDLSANLRIVYRLVTPSAVNFVTNYGMS